MAIKIIKHLLEVFLLLTILTGCPSNDDCIGLDNISNSPDLIKIIPLQNTYQLGDEISFEISISNELDGIYLFNETNDNYGLLTSNNFLFLENELTFIKGSQGEYSNWFNMPYNMSNERYELKILVKLNKVGIYSFFTDDYVEIIGEDLCNRFRIDTNIEGMNSDRKIEFEVLE